MPIFYQPIQGSFNSTGALTTIALPGGVDWMEVYNYTRANVASGAGGSVGTRFYWQRGMADNDGFVSTRNAGGTADLLASSAILGVGGFTFVDTSVNTPSTPVAITGFSAANGAVVLAATTPQVGSIVRFYSLNNQPQFDGIDFQVTAVTAGVSFVLGDLSSINSTPSTAGFYVVIPYLPMFQPYGNVITFMLSLPNVGNGPLTRITLAEGPHKYTIGQSIRLNLPGGSAVWGAYAVLDGVQAIIVGINSVAGRSGDEPNPAAAYINNITVLLDTSGLGLWSVFGAAANQDYPPAGAVPFTPARVVPVGEAADNTIIDVNGNPLNSNLLDDAMNNKAFVGMNLAAGAQSPAGQASDVIFWRAGSAYYNFVGNLPPVT